MTIERAQAPRREWWLLLGVPLILGVLVGGLVTTFTSQSEGQLTSAVVNTRPVSDLPNERLDLINDLATAMTLSPVLKPVADEFDLSLTQLRSGLSVERLESSSFARITFASSKNSATRQAVITGVLDSAKTYLSGSAAGTASPALVQAQAQQRAAVANYYAVIEANKGVAPAVQLRRLNQRLDRLEAAGATRALAGLRRAQTRLLGRVADFEAAQAQRTAANAALTAVTEQQVASASAGPNVLSADFVASNEAGWSGSVALRRGIAAGLATALLAVGFVLALTVGRRRNDPPATTTRLSA